MEMGGVLLLSVFFVANARGDVLIGMIVGARSAG
jgi:hypothetical protein